MASNSTGLPIFLYMYDVTNGLARVFSPAVIGIEIEAIWHTSIVAYGMEYYFGGFGIEFAQPGTVIGDPHHQIHLGDTEIPYEMFHEWLREMATDRFHGSKYDLFQHNCNTFTNELSQFLTGRPTPEYVRSLPDRVLATPFGRQIAQWIQAGTPRGRGTRFDANASDTPH
jgi:hypothetical protein